MGRSSKAKDRKKKELVIQGSHMVSGTRCPARSDQLKKWSESRAAAAKGKNKKRKKKKEKKKN